MTTIRNLKIMLSFSKGFESKLIFLFVFLPIPKVLHLHDLDKGANVVKLRDVVDHLGIILVVELDEYAGVWLVQTHLSPQDRHQPLVRDFDDFDELGEGFKLFTLNSEPFILHLPLEILGDGSRR